MIKSKAGKDYFYSLDIKLKPDQMKEVTRELLFFNLFPMALWQQKAKGHSVTRTRRVSLSPECNAMPSAECRRATADIALPTLATADSRRTNEGTGNASRLLPFSFSSVALHYCHITSLIILHQPYTLTKNNIAAKEIAEKDVLRTRRRLPFSLQPTLIVLVKRAIMTTLTVCGYA